MDTALNGSGKQREGAIGLLALAPLSFGVRIILRGGGLSCDCRLFSGISALCPLEALLHSDNKNGSRHC